MTELLAPAGSYEQLIAAIRCGANAVYLGTKNFNARRNADNFGEENLIGIVSYCHARNVKVYVTLNTIVKDTEFSELTDTVKEIADSGADAVLVQDAGVISLIRNCVPSLPLHASTQMAVHNVAGARLLEEMGFSRIVLARELSLPEIKEICDTVNCEIEVFVHGAHCMSASGLCYMSSALGARSGNRGLCAQPCRLNFHNKYRENALSLKDMCLVDEVSKLTEVGVASLKIEGRMKRPEYVAAAVSAYSEAIAGLNPDINTLKNVFSRSGFTKGYFEGRRNASMFGSRTKEDVINMSSALPGLASLYKNEKQIIPVEMTFSVKAGNESALTVTCDRYNINVNGSVPEKAVRLPLSEEMASKSLNKTGGTYFTVSKLNCDIDDNLSMPASEINRMRRDALQKLDELRSVAKPYPYSINYPEFTDSIHNSRNITLRFFSPEQIFDISGCNIILPIEYVTAELINRFKDYLIAALPTLIYPSDEKNILQKLIEFKNAGLKAALAENIGSAYLIKQASLEIHGGNCLNIVNSFSANMYSEIGLKSITLSHEMSVDEISEIKSPVPFGIVAYGKMPLMHFRCCPMQSDKGCGSCSGKEKLTDRMNKQFTVLCHKKRYSVLHNCVPLYIEKNMLPDADFYTLYFSDESPEQCKAIYDTFINSKSIDGPKTLGLYNKKLL